MTKIWALRSRLEKQPTDLRQSTSYFGDRTLARLVKLESDEPENLRLAFGVMLAVPNESRAYD
jgi:hypothetical protein